jgi:hypothetical protein
LRFLLLLLLSACDSGTIDGQVMCGMAACGGDPTGTWFPSAYCDDPAASGRCTAYTVGGGLTLNADKSYTAKLILNCKDGTQAILHDGSGTWSIDVVAAGKQLMLMPGGGSPFQLPYCVVGTTLAVGQTGSSLFSTWTRPSR